MLKDHFQFYKEKQETSYGLFTKQNCREHSDLITQFMTQKKGEFRLVINHFINKLQQRPDAEQIIKQNLSNIYIWRNKQNDIEGYFTDQSLLIEPKFQAQINDNTVNQFYGILLNLSSINIPDNFEINSTNYLNKIQLLYTQLVDFNQKQQKVGNTDQSFKAIKVRCRNNLMLRPSGDVIICPKITNEASNYNLVNIYISVRCPFYSPIQEEIQNPIRYKGSIDPSTCWPNGYGELDCQHYFSFKGQFQDGLATGRCLINYMNWKQEFEGNFKYGEKHGESKTKNPNGSITTGYYQNNMKQGLFQTKTTNSTWKEQLYQNDQPVNKSKYKFDSTLDTARYLMTHQDISLTNHVLNGLKDKQWVNQLCVDYYLQLVSDYFKCQLIQPIALFNTVTCQDIFTSEISKVQPQNINISDEQKRIIASNQYNRLIFILNADKVHFIVLVYKNETLYYLNSFPSQQDQKIISSFASIFPKKPRTVIIKVEEQKNSYDCSLHSVHNVLLQYKHPDLDVDKINYGISAKYITGMRRHIQYVITNDHEHIIPKIF